MLRKLEEEQFDTYVDFAYGLALDVTRSGYPTYTDGIKSRDDFVMRARRAFSRDNEEILLYERDGKVKGWIHYYHLREDRYLDTCSFCVAEGMEDAVAEFVSFAHANFPGDELYLGFPKENREAVAALEALGFARIEESFNDALDFDAYSLRPESADIVLITRDNYQLFSALHAQVEDDMYWNSKRILQDMDEWRIFVLLREGKPAGAIYYFVFDDRSMDEIFGVDFADGVFDGGVYRELVTAALNDEKRRGVRHMVFFNDGESQSDALACGFRCVGEYVCYKMTL